MTARIFLKLIAAVLGVLAISLVAVDLLASRVAEAAYSQTLSRELTEKCKTLALRDFATLAREVKVTAQAAGGRLTIVATDGRVIADSENDAAAMENHSSRPEIRAALTGGVDPTRRTSPTMGVDFLYVAVHAPEGAVRLAMPMSQIAQQVDAIRRQMLAATAVAFFPAIVVAAWFARSTSKTLGSIIEYAGELARGNFGARLSARGKDELAILSGQLNETGEKLQAMFHQLQQEQTELERLERIRKDFVINVSHELRTPLASIQGYTETLLDGAIHDSAYNVRFLEIIRQNAERLTRLTADLLTLSRIELGIAKFQFASYSVTGLVENGLDTMRPLAKKKNVHLIGDTGDGTMEVFCDSEAVHQILINLVDNAIKYTPEGGTVAVTARPVVARNTSGEPAETVEISVTDSGTGIPADDLPRLFERFYRVDKARSRELGGTGLGLAIVKHLARAQGGEAHVSSQLGHGSTFGFTLPTHDLGLGEQGAVQAEFTRSS